ncbi:hypothetical protein ACSLBF_13755 [Pseudoalteromonas sp. T1lg65]|uniref:hypothetical protein n=1 Tax=Pseudoalteromonas sp. T1lg65 TaxID=2077101 RepID=UPI003F792B7F
MQIKASSPANMLNFERNLTTSVSKNETEDINEVLRKKVAADYENDPNTIKFTKRAQLYRVIDLSGSDEPPKYQYGRLTDLDDIEAFLTHQDRLDKDKSEILRNYIPSKEYLTLLDKMDDDTLNKFVDMMSSAFNVEGFFIEKTQDKAQELIATMSQMSEEQIVDTINTLSKLAEKEQAAAPSQVPKLLLPGGSVENVLFHRFSKSAQSERLWQYSFENNKQVDKYVDLLSSGKFSEEDLQEINHHLRESPYDQSKGILDMAMVIKKNDHQPFIEMLSSADELSENNVFSYVSQQLDIDEHTSAYKSTEGGHVFLTDSLPDDSERQRLYSQLINAFENQGMGWMEDTIEHIKEKPPQVQADIWKTLNKEVLEKPEQFNKTDSIESWMELHLASFTREFEQKQIKALYKMADEADVPINLGLLTWQKQTSLIIDKDAKKSTGS